MALDLLVIFLATLLSRLLVARHQEAAFDVHGHLYFAQSVARQGVGPFGRITMNVVGAGAYSQPFVWHWVIGRFDPERIRRQQSWLNGVIDAAFVVAAHALALQAGFDRETALLAVALYLLTPMWFSSIAIGPRIAGFTPRLSAEVATNLFFLVLMLPLPAPPALVFAAAIALAAFVLSSSKFGVQAMLFLTPLACLLAQDLRPLLALVAATALLVVVSRGETLTQLRSQLGHLAWYFRENLRGRMHISERNSLRALFRVEGATARERLTRFAYRAVGENSFTAVVLKMPLLGLIAFGAAQVGLDRLFGGEHRALAAPVAAAVVLFVLVSLRPLLFLGEAERYLNHVAFFVALLAARLTVEASLWPAALLLLAYGFTFWLLEAFALPRLTPQRLRERAREDTAVLQHLKARPRQGSVLSYPYHAGGGAWRIMAETAHPVVFCLGLAPAFAARFNERYADAYPCVRLDRLEEMADEYDIGYLVVDLREVAARQGPGWTPGPHWHREPLGGEIYAVYTRDVPRAHEPQPAPT
jgi:hypothetical protein